MTITATATTDPTSNHHTSRIKEHRTMTTAATISHHPLAAHRASQMTRRLTIAGLLILALILLATTGCSSADASEQAAEPGGPFVGADWSEGSARAIVDQGGPIQVYDAMHGAHLMTMTETTEFGTPRVFLVEEQRTNWLRVRLPARPNHQVGWIRAEDVTVETLDLQVYVDLESRVLTVKQGDMPVMSTVVGIGSDEHQTPTGTFFVTDKLQTPEPDGAYGPYALGLSGYSETLTEFAGGDGQIGLHGTNNPASVGANVSHGCLRVANQVITELAELLPVGTPIHIS
jgi:hypothetical protein